MSESVIDKHARDSNVPPLQRYGAPPAVRWRPISHLNDRSSVQHQLAVYLAFVRKTRQASPVRSVCQEATRKKNRACGVNAQYGADNVQRARHKRTLSPLRENTGRFVGGKKLRPTLKSTRRKPELSVGLTLSQLKRQNRNTYFRTSRCSGNHCPEHFHCPFSC